jgi:hypothetical protein
MSPGRSITRGRPEGGVGNSAALTGVSIRSVAMELTPQIVGFRPALGKSRWNDPTGHLWDHGAGFWLSGKGRFSGS